MNKKVLRCVCLLFVCCLLLPVYNGYADSGTINENASYNTILNSDMEPKETNCSSTALSNQADHDNQIWTIVFAFLSSVCGGSLGVWLQFFYERKMEKEKRKNEEISNAYHAVCHALYKCNDAIQNSWYFDKALSELTEFLDAPQNSRYKQVFNTAFSTDIDEFVKGLNEKSKCNPNTSNLGLELQHKNLKEYIKEYIKQLEAKENDTTRN